MEHSPRLGPPANHQPASSPGDAEELNLGAARIEWLRQKQRHRAVAHRVLPVAVLGGEREVDHPWTHRYLGWRPKRRLERNARRRGLDDPADFAHAGDLRQFGQLFRHLLLRKLAFHSEDELTAMREPLVLELSDVKATGPRLQGHLNALLQGDGAQQLTQAAEQLAEGGPELGELEFGKRDWIGVSAESGQLAGGLKQRQIRDVRVCVPRLREVMKHRDRRV